MSTDQVYSEEFVNDCLLYDAFLLSTVHAQSEEIPYFHIHTSGIDHVKYILKRYYRDNLPNFLENRCFEMGLVGNIEAVQWSMDSGMMIDDNYGRVCEGAACGGQLNILEAIRDKKGIAIINKSTAVVEAMNNNRIHVLKWLNKNACISKEDIDALFTNAVTGNLCDVLKFVLSIIPDDHILDDDNAHLVWNNVIKNGNHDIIDLVYKRINFESVDHDKDCTLLALNAKLHDEQLWKEDNAHGHVECLRYLRLKGFPWKPDAETRERANSIGIE